MTRPLLLDLFCGAGGAAMGYSRAGFDVVGVDNRPQPHYPFPFIQADALTLLERFIEGGWVAQSRPSPVETRQWSLEHFAAIHASPPCQYGSKATIPQRRHGKTYPSLICPTRLLLESAGLPWVIENTPGNPVRPDYWLCGCQFDLPGLRRERWFETSWGGAPDLRSPCYHVGRAIGVEGHGQQGREIRAGHPKVTQEDRKRAMGIDWMNRDELAQAIPPAYTEYIGTQLLAHLGVSR